VFAALILVERNFTISFHLQKTSLSRRAIAFLCRFAYTGTLQSPTTLGTLCEHKPENLLLKATKCPLSTCFECMDMSPDHLIPINADKRERCQVQQCVNSRDSKQICAFPLSPVAEGFTARSLWRFKQGSTGCPHPQCFGNNKYSRTGGSSSPSPRGILSRPS
jgi:hypothetical protein